VTDIEHCIVRPYRDTDADVVRSLIAELQDTLRGLDTHLPRGEQMADAYLTYTFEHCRMHDGRILLAEVRGVVVGFATVLNRLPFESPDSPTGHFAYLMDLGVRAGFRGRGIGSALMAAAEEVAHSAGALEFRTLVLHGNRAVNLYRRCGMTDYSLTLRKRLDNLDAMPPSSSS
jgi:ribosomal protein S18 acetylase RimI-like enzyme